MTANPQNTWEQLKRQLSVTFSEVTDPQHTLSLQRKIRQTSGENIQVFAERIFELAEEAFLGQGGNVIERLWLVGFGFHGPLRQYFSVYRAVSQREGERGKKG